MEVVLVVSALLLALFYPYSPQGPVFVILIQALMNYFKAQSFVVSIL